MPRATNVVYDAHKRGGNESRSLAHTDPVRILIVEDDSGVSTFWARLRAVIGVEIVRGIKALRVVLPIIRHHHERIDGAGYPDGLSGDQIPLEARIMAIADAYDTMTSDRAYRRAMSQDEAIAELRRGRGTQWDADLIDRFIELLNAEAHLLRLTQPRAAQASPDQAAVHIPHIALPQF